MQLTIWTVTTVNFFTARVMGQHVGQIREWAGSTARTR